VGVEKVTVISRLNGGKGVVKEGCHALLDHHSRRRAHHDGATFSRYLCPAGQPLNFVGLNVRNRTHAYIGSRKRCGACSQKAQCTTGQYKYLAIHIHEPARQHARELARTPAFANFQRERKKVEALFAELKNQIGLRRLRLRRLKFVREQFFLAAAAQNIKRLVRFLSQGPRPPLPVTN
jgi:Transposase DDE domain